MMWTDEQTEVLKRLWAAGHSGSAIARQLGGCSRSAVIGKVHRLKLAGRTESANMSKAEHHERINRSPWTRKHTPTMENGPSVRAIIRDGTPIPSPKETDIPRIATTDLENHHCRWPCTANPRETPPWAPQFCGQPKVPGVSYCEAHIRRAFAPPPPRRIVRAPADRVLEAA